MRPLKYILCLIFTKSVYLKVILKVWRSFHLAHSSIAYLLVYFLYLSLSYSLLLSLLSCLLLTCVFFTYVVTLLLIIPPFVFIPLTLFVLMILIYSILSVLPTVCWNPGLLQLLSAIMTITLTYTWGLLTGLIIILRL